MFIQHLDPNRESMLSQILSRTTQIAVSEATDQTAVEPNHIHVIPANAELFDIAWRAPGGRSHTRTTAVDSFFRALTQDRADQTIGVVLSGNGSDGALGLAAIKPSTPRSPEHSSTLNKAPRRESNWRSNHPKVAGNDSKSFIGTKKLCRRSIRSASN